jgi:hypothetical protein
MTSILDSSDPQEGREKKKRKEADMESEEDEEEWERRDAQKQAQKKAKLLPARQVSNPFFSFGSSHHEQTPEKTELWSARQNLGNNQKPFVSVTPLRRFPEPRDLPPAPAPLPQTPTLPRRFQWR